MCDQDRCLFRLDEAIAATDDCQAATIDQDGYSLNGTRIVVHNVQAEDQPIGVHVFTGHAGVRGVAIRCDNAWYITHMECS